MYHSHNCDVRIVKDKLSEEDAFKKEKELIAYYRNKTNYRLANRTDGGEGASGLKHTNETKKQIAIIGKRMWNNSEYRNKMIKIRNLENGAYKSVEFREKMRELCLGSKNPNFNNRWSTEQKSHLSKVRIERQLAKGIKNPNAKSIICLETGEVFGLISDAQKKYGVKSITSFSIALKDEKRTAANLHWQFYEEPLLDESKRLEKLLGILARSNKYPIYCFQTKEIFNSRKDFLVNKKIEIKKFNKEYQKNKKYQIDENEYMYVKDYLSRYMQ